MSPIYWSYFFYLFLWTLPGAGNVFLEIRFQKQKLHYFVYFFSLGFLASVFWEADSVETSHYIFFAVGALLVFLCFIQGQAGYKGRDSVFSICLAILILMSALFSKKIMLFFGLGFDRVWLTLAAINSTYLYLVNVQSGLKQKVIWIDYKVIASAFLIGSSLIFLSQEIYPSRKFGSSQLDLDQLSVIFLYATFIEVIPRSLFHKKILIDTLTIPLLLEIILIASIQIAFFYFVFESVFLLQAVFLYATNAFLFHHTRRIGFPLYYTLFVFLLLAAFLSFPEIK